MSPEAAIPAEKNKSPQNGVKQPWVRKELAGIAAPEADICLFLEGTYPYISGGVSGWTHDLIKSHPHLTFTLISLVPPHFVGERKYDLPPNVIAQQDVKIQSLEVGDRYLSEKKKKVFFEGLERPFLHLQSKGNIDDLKAIISLMKETGVELGEEILIHSEDAWKLIVRMYSASLGNASFLDFYWTWIGLIGGLYSILLGPLPKAKVYHSFCTGYAGLYLARAAVETGRPALVTEHGIYTNERRIEIVSTEWIKERQSINLNIEKRRKERGLKDLWMDTFSSYSRITYQAAELIITLHEGNQPLQIIDGADPKKLRIIPNGIDIEAFANLPRDPSHPPTVALIGRVVPIKDIKTFIRAIGYLKQSIPDVQALIMGPNEEDIGYFEECKELVKSLDLEHVITFTGKVNVRDYFPRIDIVALTSISESQPLSILEAGAAGIPCVATSVGACSELIFGRKQENPPLGAGGRIVPLANPLEIAKEMTTLLLDKHLWTKCSEAMRKRMKTYYNQALQTQAYGQLYEQLMHEATVWQG